MRLIKKLVNGWKRVGCAGHFGAHHKWWVVVLFWAIVGLAGFALLTLLE